MNCKKKLTKTTTFSKRGFIEFWIKRRKKTYNFKEEEMTATREWGNFAKQLKAMQQVTIQAQQLKL
jgi:hypothetical protein